jgi:uncharacterized protein YbjT (DUF2867 family)
MNIIVGATGRVGSHLINDIKQYSVPIRAVVRNPKKLGDKSIEFRKADLFDFEQLLHAFEGGTTVFVITPESMSSHDIIGDTERIVDNYRKAIEQTGIKNIVGLSCVGAHIDGDNGNIRMSRILEQGFEGLQARKVFIRPSYYFSNWVGYLDTINQHGLLPTFFPEDLNIEMNSPVDVARFIAKVMVEEDVFENKKKIFELSGPRLYSPRDVVSIYSEVLNKPINLQVIPSEKWQETLLSVGFSENTAANLADMTRSVVENTARAEWPDDLIKLPTTLENYLIRETAKNI